MDKPYIIRKLDWEDLNEDGIPKDCAEIMDYFNRGLGKNTYPLVPRQNPITVKEILEVWIPTKDETITYVAVDIDTDKVILSLSFLPLGEKRGKLSITKDPDYLHRRGEGTDATKAIIKEALDKGNTIEIQCSVKNLGPIRIMNKLGYGNGKLIKNYKRYSDGGVKDNDVYEWVIEPD